MNDIHMPPLKILVLRTAAIGDVLVAASILPELYRKYNQPDIDFYTQSPELLRGNPYIHDVLIRMPDRQKYDEVLDLDMAYESHPQLSIQQAYAARAGISDSKLILELRIPENLSAKVEKVLSDEKVTPGKKLVAIQSASGFWTRNMPLGFLKQIVERMETHGQFRFLLFGAPHDPCIHGTHD
ncbi:MAG: hypothetical protein V1913_16385, partial [Fibrobacterota bacterium]